MADVMLTKLRLCEGVWEGLLSAPRAMTPRLRLWHRDELLGEPETIATEAAGEGRAEWLVRFPLPVERLSDGMQTFVIEDAETGAALAHETLLAGEALDADALAELSLLRAELDLLKRAFRRHCSEEG